MLILRRMASGIVLIELDCATVLDFFVENRHVGALLGRDRSELGEPFRRARRVDSLLPWLRRSPSRFALVLVSFGGKSQ